MIPAPYLMKENLNTRLQRHRTKQEMGREKMKLLGAFLKGDLSQVKSPGGGGRGQLISMEDWREAEQQHPSLPIQDLLFPEELSVKDRSCGQELCRT